MGDYMTYSPRNSARKMQFRSDHLLYRWSTATFKINTPPRRTSMLSIHHLETSRCPAPQSVDSIQERCIIIARTFPETFGITKWPYISSGYCWIAANAFIFCIQQMINMFCTWARQCGVNTCSRPLSKNKWPKVDSKLTRIMDLRGWRWKHVPTPTMTTRRPAKTKVMITAWGTGEESSRNLRKNNSFTAP